jgi:hypothetical protein
MMTTSLKSNNGKAGINNENRLNKDGNINSYQPARDIIRAGAGRIMKAGQKAPARRYRAPGGYSNIRRG